MNNANFDMVDDLLKYYESKGFDIYYESPEKRWSVFIESVSEFDDKCWKNVYYDVSLKEAIAAMEFYLEGSE